MQLRRLLSTASPLAMIAAAFAFSAGTAHAQSTGTLEMEEIIVSANKISENLNGLITAEQITKSRSEIDQSFLETQLAGQSVIQSINLLPGVSFTNNDPYGSSGGDLRLRSFDGPRISLTFDGMPLNDTGNYAVFTNQLLDPEIIEKTTVNLGTTDVDSPTASATGGTINFLSRRPTDSFSVMGVFSGGSYNDRRVFGSVDSGAFGPWGTSMFVAASYQDYDKFKGPGDLEKLQFNAKIYQPIGDHKDDFIAIGFHFNRNRNAAYRTLSTADIAAVQIAPATYGSGTKLDYIANCVLTTPHAGVADNDGSGNAADPTTPASCTNYIGTRINPSDTGNIRIQSSYHVTDNISVTVDPNYQYVLATGGTTTGTTSETDGRLKGTKNTGVDLNGDGDTLDTIRLYDPSVTHTDRWGVLASAIWKFMDGQALRVAYTLDYGLHRQTGDAATLQPSGDPWALFPHYNRVHEAKSNDGVPFRFRDRKSVAELNQFSANYTGEFMDNQVRLDLGIRAPYFHRELHQYCYTQAGTSNAYCSTQIPSAPNAQGFVTFPNSPTTGANSNTTQYLAPFNAVRDYNKVLPNVGLSYRPGDGPHMIYASFSEGLSAPRTDDLYSLALDPTANVARVPTVAPETTNAYELGYRYQTQALIASASVWKIDYNNRIVTSYDPILNISLARNIGPVDLYGFDGEVGFRPFEGFTVYGSASYDHSKLINNLQVTATTVAPTAGKKLVETPDWTFSIRGQYQIDDFQFGAQVKYTGKRFATDVNDEIAPSYTLVDIDARYDLTSFGAKNTFVQFNVLNLFDKTYFGSISSRTTNNPAVPGYSGLPAYNIGAPRTIQGTLHVQF